jgi:hypothetical protein
MLPQSSPLYISVDPAKANTDKTIYSIIITSDFIRKLLTDTIIPLTDTITLKNPLSLEDRIRIGNWFMIELATKIGQFEAPMTRKELIDKLKEYDEIDPEGLLEITLKDCIEVTDVSIKDAGGDKWLEIL